MAERTVLITGGAGFIGSHLVDRLVAADWKVRVLDSIEPQVHGTSGGIRRPGAEYVQASVLDTDELASALVGIENIVHLAAQVGVGQSMYELQRYVKHNSLGTAALLETLLEHGRHVSTLIVASSMSIYGEGQYRCDVCGDRDGRVAVRSREQLAAGRWEPTCRVCGAPLVAEGTPESKPLLPDSVYATTKRDQEELCLTFGRAYGLRTLALRFFNVYGSRQSLSNPYTGVAAIFASRLLNGQRPLVFENGLQSRDFVHVSDIARAIELALTSDADGLPLNAGTGRATSVLEVATTLARHLEVDLQPKVVERFRHGDIRHCFADITRIRDVLGYEPKVTFEDGLKHLTRWILTDLPEARDGVDASTAELEERGLVV